MKNLFLPILLLVGLSIGKPVFAQDRQDVEAVVQKAIESFSAKDYTTYFSYLSEDLEIFTGVSTPLLHIGKTHWMNWINGLKELPVVTYRQQQNTVRVYNGNAAVVNGYFVFTTVDKSGNAETQTGRNSTFLVKQNGKWLIVNYHFSKMFK